MNNSIIELAQREWNKKTPNIDMHPLYLEGYKNAAQNNGVLLKALQRYETAFQKLFTVPLGKENELSLKIWFSIASSEAKEAIKKAEA